MTTLGIFTVKNLVWHAGAHHTYGGFGEYLTAMRAEFPRTLLFAHVRTASPPSGHYLIPPGPDLEVVPLPYNRSEFDVLCSLPAMWRTAMARIDDVDVVHARMPDYTGIVGALAARRRGKPFFCQIVDDWYLAAGKMPWSRRGGLGTFMKLHLYLYDWCERQVCRGQLVFAQGATCFSKHAPHSDCEEVLSTAIHLEDIVAPRPRFAGPHFRILSVARLTGVKNQALILHALARLRREDTRWQLSLVGQGPYETRLRELAQTLGVADAVTFAGQVGRGPPLWSQFDDADCFVLSSRSEGTPKVLLESMARGLPIVASRVSGVPSMVSHGNSGLLFEDNDVDALVDCLKRMAGDEALRNRAAATAQAFCREHTVELATRRMLDKVFDRWPQLRPAEAVT